MQYQSLQRTRRTYDVRVISALFICACIKNVGAALLEIPGGHVDEGATFTVESGDTLLTGDLASKNSDNITIGGTFINKGYTIFNAATMVDGEIRNSGILQLNGDTWTTASNFESPLAIINEASGLMIFSGYFDSYIRNQGTSIENFGTMRFMKNLYNKTGIGAGFPYFGNTIKNHGIFTIDFGSNNSCHFDTENPNAGIINDGVFEIKAQSSCYLPYYTQTSGKTVINGKFGSRNMNIQKGVLSGSGTITLEGNENTVQFGGTISPGEDLGTLTVVNDLTIDGSIEMQLGGTAGNDKLVVNGNLNLNSARLFVSFREQYLLGLGQEVTLISASNISGSAVLAGFPRLPGNLGYELVQTTTSVKMRISSNPR